MNISLIARYIGSILLLNALLMVGATVVSGCYGLDTAFFPLLLSAVITGMAGLAPLFFVKRNARISTREGYVVLFFAWLLSCLFGMLPYLLWGGEFNLINAWYESVSGFTTTGGTIVSEIESLPHGLLFWRSATQWIGGMGVVLLMLIVLPEQSAARLRLSKMELSSLSKDYYQFKVQRILRVIAWVYFGLTLAAFVSYMLVGMGFFDALNHAFSTVATGGFSTKNQSINSFHNIGVEWVAMIFMLLAGMHFGLLYVAITGKSLNLFRSPVVRYYLVSLLVCGVLISLNLWWSGVASSFGESFRLGIFQSIAMGTTTGFATAGIALWPAFSLFLLIFLSIQCACSGSTSGGIKADRLCIFWISIGAQIRRQLHPQAYVSVRIGGHNLDPDAVASVNLYIGLYLIVILVVSFILSLFGLDMTDAFSASVAHMGNVGPGFGSADGMSNYAHFSVMSKLMFCIEMLLGRLEIYGFIMIFFLHKWR
ncbi:MAG: TrkH family potassium uptake protein [Bacteroidetes bacterium]|nr:TrkH family potassium uptake protein [Bacteroidota bacterium]